MWYVPDFARNCVKAIWWYFPRKSLGDGVSHEFNIVFVERTVLLELSLQPVRSLKNLFFVNREAYVICALDTLSNFRNLLSSWECPFSNFVFYQKVMAKRSVSTNFLYGYPAATHCWMLSVTHMQQTHYSPSSEGLINGEWATIFTCHIVEWFKGLWTVRTYYSPTTLTGVTYKQNWPITVQDTNNEFELNSFDPISV